MKWRLLFYRERTGTLARYAIEARTPAEALSLGRRALLTEYPATTARRTPSLFQQAQSVGGQASDGWVLYRIAKDEEIH